MDTADAGESRLLRQILGHVRSCTGLDFSCYREPTMRRRVRNRMICVGIGTAAEGVYAEDTLAELPGVLRDRFVVADGVLVLGEAEWPTVAEEAVPA